MLQVGELGSHRLVLGDIGQLLQAAVACFNQGVDFFPFLAERFERALVFGKPFHGLLDVGSSGSLQSGGERVGGLPLHAVVRQVLNLLQLVNGFGICSRTLLRIVTDTFPILLLFGKGVGGQRGKVGKLVGHDLHLGIIGKGVADFLGVFKLLGIVSPLCPVRCGGLQFFGNFNGFVDFVHGIPKRILHNGSRFLACCFVEVGV